MNAIQGNPLTNDEGSTVTSTSMSLLGMENAEGAAEYMEVLGNPEYLFFTEDEISNMLVSNNPDMNEAALQEIVDNYTFE